MTHTLRRVGTTLAAALAAVVLGGTPVGSQEEGSPAPEGAAAPLTADEIMGRVENQKRPRFFEADIIITTKDEESGKTLIQSGKIGVESLAGEPGHGKNDYRSMIRLKEPQHWNGAKSFEERTLDSRRQVVCLPEMKSCRPVAKGTEAMFGSEIEWGDLAQADREKFDYTMEREDPDQWVVKGVSKEETGLVYHLRVDKATNNVINVLKEKAGTPIKEITTMKSHTISGWEHPVPTVIIVKNLRRSKSSQFVMMNSVANRPIPKVFFSFD